MNCNKTIAFYIGSLSMGGAEHVMVNLAAFFKSEGYSVYIVTKLIDEPEYDVPEGVTRIIADITREEELNSRVANLINRLRKLRRIWKEIKPDIIVSFIRKNNLMAIASTRGMGIPVAVGIRSNPARELKGRFFKLLSFFLFGFADGIIMQTNSAVGFLPKYLQKKAVVMPNSIDESYIGNTLESVRKTQIVVVGRIDENKNQKMVLQAFENVMSEYPEWSLHIYGDGEDRIKLEQKYNSDRIIFHGQVSHIKDAIREASVFVLPSRQEGMPNALIEAMALGLACISTDCPCGGPADLIRQNENGILIPVDDEEELERQLKRIMSDYDLRKRIGKEAAKVSEILSPNIVNAKWKSYIESLM